MFRFLQRRFGTTAPERSRLECFGLRLSSASGPSSVRVLTPTDNLPDARAWLETAAPTLAEAFPPHVTFLCSDDSTGLWEARVWRDGAVAERAGGAAKETGRLVRFLSGIAGGPPRASAQAIGWASERELPTGLVPALSPRPLPVVEYDAVASLDMRGLLVEETPCLYHFDFAAPDGERAV